MRCTADLVSFARSDDMTIELNADELVAITGAKTGQVAREQRLHIRGVAVSPTGIRGGELFVPAGIQDRSAVSAALAEAWSRGAAAALIEGDSVTTSSAIEGFPAERIFIVSSIRNAVELLARWWSAKLEVVVFAVLESSEVLPLFSEVLRRLLLAFGRGVAAQHDTVPELANALCLLNCGRENRWAILRCVTSDIDSILRVAELARIFVVPHDCGGLVGGPDLLETVADLGVAVIKCEGMPAESAQKVVFTGEAIRVAASAGDIDPFAGRGCRFEVSLATDSAKKVSHEIVDFVLPSFDSRLLPSVAAAAAAICAYAGAEAVQILRQVVQGGAVTVSNRVSWLPWGHVITIIDDSEQRRQEICWREVDEVLGALTPEDGVPSLVVIPGKIQEEDDLQENERLALAIRELKERTKGLRVVLFCPKKTESKANNKPAGQLGADFAELGSKVNGIVEVVGTIEALYHKLLTHPFSVLLLVGIAGCQEFNIADELVQKPAPRWSRGE